MGVSGAHASLVFVRTSGGTGQNTGLGTRQRALLPGWLSCPAGLGSFFFISGFLVWGGLVSAPQSRGAFLCSLCPAAGYADYLRFHTQHLLSPHGVLHFPPKSTCSICFIGKPRSSPLKTESAENPLQWRGQVETGCLQMAK